MSLIVSLESKMGSYLACCANLLGLMFRASHVFFVMMERLGGFEIASDSMLMTCGVVWLVASQKKRGLSCREGNGCCHYSA